MTLMYEYYLMWVFNIKIQILSVNIIID